MTLPLIFLLFSVQPAFPRFDAKAFFQQVKLFIRDGVDPRQVGDLHIDLSSFFRGFDQAEGLIQVFAGSINPVLAPDHQPGGSGQPLPL